MFDANFHTHTIYDDGTDSPEEMVLEAISIGLKAIGFSVHSYLPYENDWCIKKADEKEYIKEIGRLKKKYAGDIRIYNGIELDYYSDQAAEDYDYVIGSVHTLLIDGKFYDLDDTPEKLVTLAEEKYSGNIYSLIDDYYSLVSEIYSRTSCDIIGHFDLISKFNENGDLFDPADSRYISAYRNAADSLAGCSAIFEVNTGAVARGYRKDPYPAYDVYEYLESRGARFILTSDCHAKENLIFGFEDALSRYGNIGTDLKQSC